MNNKLVADYEFFQYDSDQYNSTPIDHDQSLENLENLAKIVIANVVEWKKKNITARDLSIYDVVGGLSNKLYCIECNNENIKLDIKKVLIRIYGKDKSNFVDIKSEIRLSLQLDSYGIGAKIIATFEGGRIEEWINGRTLRTNELYKTYILSSIAIFYAKLHKLDETHKSILEHKCKEALIITQLKKWAKQIKLLYLDTDIPKHDKKLSHERNLIKNTLARNSTNSIDALSINYLVNETENAIKYVIDKIVQDINNNNFLFQLKFCHNDLHGGNIMETETGLRFIDFEYAGYNYPAYDIAFIFGEMTIDYTEKDFPHFKHKSSAEDYPSNEIISIFGAIYLSYIYDEQILLSDNRVKEFILSIRKMSLLAELYNVYFALFSIPHGSRISKMDFYACAKSRLNSYINYKKDLIDKKIITNF